MTIFFPKHFDLGAVHQWFREHNYATFYVADGHRTPKGWIFTFIP